jgi:hypothetical protein
MAVKAIALDDELRAFCVQCHGSLPVSIEVPSDLWVHAKRLFALLGNDTRQRSPCTGLAAN